MKKTILMISLFQLLLITAVKSQLLQTSNPDFGTRSNLQIIEYIGGDLSVKLTHRSTEYDRCNSRYKISYDLTIKNSDGNIPFSFLVAFKTLSQPLPMFLENDEGIGSALVVYNLGINDERSVRVHAYGYSNSAIGMNFEVVATIEKLTRGGNYPVAYVIKSERNQRNNTSTARFNIPLTPSFQNSQFDNITPRNLPASATNIFTVSPGPLPVLWGTCNNSVVGESPFHYPDFEYIRHLSFIKISCFSLGIPYYYIKCTNKYISLNAFSNTLQLTDDPQGLYSQWVFEKAGNDDTQFHIYNVGIGISRRLIVKYDNSEETCVAGRLCVYDYLNEAGNGYDRFRLYFGN